MNINKNIEDYIFEIESKLLNFNLLISKLDKEYDLIKYYEECPFFFSIVYLTSRKYFSNERINNRFNLSNDPNDHLLNNFSAYKYFANIEIDMDRFYDEFDEDNDDYFEILNSYNIRIIINTIKREIDNFKLKYNFTLFTDKFDDDDIVNLIVDYDLFFEKYFLVPIYIGKYDNELEKLAKQCLMELKLRKN